MKIFFNKVFFLMLLLNTFLTGSPFTYKQLYEHCIQIKRNIIAIQDIRSHRDDQIEAAITLYLEKIPTEAARNLLDDFKKSNFNFELLWMIQ